MSSCLQSLQNHQTQHNLKYRRFFDMSRIVKMDKQIGMEGVLQIL